MNEGDGRYEIVERAGRKAVTPEPWSQYLYFRLDEEHATKTRSSSGRRGRLLRDRIRDLSPSVRLDRSGRPLRGSLQGSEPALGWRARIEPRWKRALFIVDDFDPARFQNVEASFRMEIRQDFQVAQVAVSSELPARSRSVPRSRASSFDPQVSRAGLSDLVALRRDHQPLQLSLHVLPRRDHGAAPRHDAVRRRLQDLRPDRAGKEPSRTSLSGEAPSDGRAHHPSAAGRHRALRGARRREFRSSSIPTAAFSPRSWSTVSTTRGSPTSSSATRLRTPNRSRRGRPRTRS